MTGRARRRIVDAVRDISLLLLLLLPALVAGCGNFPAAEGDGGSETRVTILAVNEDVGRAVFEFTCGPAGGDLPSPEPACAAVEETPELLTSPEPFTCLGGLFSWWELTISGRLRGRPVRSRVSTCWTPQMELIGRLGIARSLEQHLLPRRRVELAGRERRTVPAGVLEPGDLVVCEIDGRRLERGVSSRVEVAGETGYVGVGVTRVALTVTRHRDGSVTAVCTSGEPSR